GRVGVAAINEAAFVLEPFLRFFGGCVDVALGEEQRLGGLGEGGTQAAPMHQPRLKAPRLVQRICRLVRHARTPASRCQATKNRPNPAPLASSRAPFGRSSRAAF